MPEQQLISIDAINRGLVPGLDGAAKWYDANDDVVKFEFVTITAPPPPPGQSHTTIDFRSWLGKLKLEDPERITLLHGFSNPQKEQLYSVEDETGNRGHFILRPESGGAHSGSLEIGEQLYVFYPEVPRTELQNGEVIHAFKRMDHRNHRHFLTRGCPPHSPYWSGGPILHDMGSIELLVMCSKIVSDRWGSDLETNVRDIIQKTNEGLRNSHIDSRVEVLLGQAFSTTYVETRDFCHDLANLRAGQHGLENAVRERTRGNIVVLLVDTGGKGKTRNDLMVVNINYLINGTFQHELGHVFKAFHHDDPTAPNQFKGYLFPGTTHQTIMGISETHDRINLYSHPHINVDGTTYFTGGRDVAKLIQERSGNVRQFPLTT